MRYSNIFAKTSKSANVDEKIISSSLLHKAGFIRESTSGRFFFLPLGIRSHHKVMNIIKEEMDNSGAQEMITPVLHPLALWQETNRDKSTGYELMTVKDRREAEFALGGTAEEMMIDVVRKFQLSYKDLPFNIYQFSTKFRDELRARGGLLRVREFMMKDAYSFHKDEEDFKKEYDKMAEVYTKIFKKMGLDTIIVESDNGYIGGDYCHEFVVESEVGESRFLMTEDGSYAAHEDVAVFKKDDKNQDEEERKMTEVIAERGNSMEDGVKLHNLPLWQQIKDVMYIDENGRFVLAIIRGDYDVNETKLKNLLDVHELRSAEEDEIRTKLKTEPGFISPVQIKDNLSKEVKLIIVADDSVHTIKNAYCGANKKNKDLININFGRDYQADVEGDIAMAQAGFKNMDGKKLVEKKGIEVGNIFQLGYYYSDKMKNATFTDSDGKTKKYYMGCYGIGVGRTMATVVEKYHDDKGMIWPESVAPYKVHLLNLGKEKEIKEKSEKIYGDLLKNNIEVLYDDRDSSAGEKLADADLIGCPYRVIVSKKTIEKSGVEFKKRSEKDSSIINDDELIKILVD